MASASVIMNPTRDPIPDSVELEETSCPICGSADCVTVVSSHDRLTKLPGEYRVVRCTGCGLMRTNPRPSATTIAYYYPDDYSPFQKRESQSTEAKGARGILGRLSNKIFQFNTAKIPEMTGRRMLEVGCGSGRYLAAMKARGWSVAGVEPSPFAAEAAKRICNEIYVCAVEDLRLENVTYDLVVGWTVFEHLHQPLVALEKIRNVMHQKSYLVLSMPNASSFSYRLFGPYTIDWDLPRHLFHYSPKTLSQIAREAGLKIVKVSHQRVLSNFFSSLGFYLDEKIRRPRNAMVERFIRWCINYATNAGYAHLLLYPVAFILAAFGQTGRMTIWLQREDQPVKPTMSQS